MTLNICYQGWCLLHAWVAALILIVPFIIIPIAKKRFVKFPTKDEALDHKQRTRGLRWLMVFTRIILISLLLLAIATPYRVTQTVKDGDPTLKILIDNSSSFQLFDTDVISEVESGLSKHIPVETKVVARGDNSPLGDGIINSVGQDENILLISDGQATQGKPLGDMVLFAANLNASISALDIEPIRSDAAITVVGPPEIIAGSEATYHVKISEANDPEYDVEVLFDGSPVNLDGNTFKVRPSRGFHTIEARINANDHFDQNNLFYKTVKVIPKPSVLYVSQKGSNLLEVYNDIYDVDQSPTIPSDLSSYHAVILNDLPASQIDSHVERLSDYLIQGGNGLLVLGGQNSFDRGGYKGSLTETLLPVKAGKGKPRDSPEVSAVIVMDISGSSDNTFGGTSSSSRIEFTKALALAVLNDFSEDNKVGVVAFNEKAFEVAPLAPLPKTLALSEKIASLKSGGGTFIEAGLTMANAMLANEKGSRNIVLISDGIANNKFFIDDIAQSIGDQGIRIFAVGVGEGTDAEYMSQIASHGNGVYLQPTEHERLNLIFGPPQDQNEQFTSLIVNTKTHFIARSLQLATSITGFNYVVPKSSATSVITTDQNHPIVSTWRFGLGRVAAFTTDDGGAWSGTLLKPGSISVHTRTLNWVIGDPGRTQEVDVKVKDVRLPDPLQIIVQSPDPPSAEGLNFYKLDADLYGASIDAEQGIHEYIGAKGAVNYPKEYAEIGLNPSLESMVKATGGKLFEPDQIDDIVEHVRTISKRTTTESQFWRWPLVVLALLIFLVEIAIRRISENKSVIK